MNDQSRQGLVGSTLAMDQPWVGVRCTKYHVALNKSPPLGPHFLCLLLIRPEGVLKAQAGGFH